MDENKVIDLHDVTNLKKKPWYKRAWNKIKEIKESIVDWCDDNFEIVTGALIALAAGIWGYLFGWLDGRKNGYSIGYKEGDCQGFRDGYHDCINDLDKSGYKVYGHYGENDTDMIVKKVTEEKEV